MNTLWRLLADVVVGVHYTFLLYLIVGGFLALRRPWTIWLHVGAAVWGTLIVTTGVLCPLTAAQNFLREQGGLPPLHGGFISGYVKGTLYPARYETLTQALVAVVVAVSWVVFVRHRRERSRRARAADVRDRGRVHDRPELLR